MEMMRKNGFWGDVNPTTYFAGIILDLLLNLLLQIRFFSEDVNSLILCFVYARFFPALVVYIYRRDACMPRFTRCCVLHVTCFNQSRVTLYERPVRQTFTKIYVAFCNEEHIQDMYMRHTGHMKCEKMYIRDTYGTYNTRC